MNKIQFRVLHREFLRRLFDVELLSTHARGDASALLGQVSVLIVLVGLVLVAPVIVFDAKMTPDTFFIASLSVEHFLICTTMLMVGLFAVLSWNATFPEKRDILILTPLPLRARTIFLAKISAIGSALGIAVLVLHGLAGLAWPFVLNKRMPAHSFPALTSDPALSPVDVANLPAVLDQDFRPLLSAHGILAGGTGGGLAIGVYQHGVRRVMTYGSASPDSLFETGSIGKTFTGLVLARMVEEGRVRFDEPVRLLLPQDTVEKPTGEEIRLIDLATHHSGLPAMPNNLHAEDDAVQQYDDYHAADLYAYLANRGVHKRKDAPFSYSNLGFAVLGNALANRAGLSYAELVQREVVAPLGLRDTVISPSPEQRNRFIQGYDRDHHRAQPFELDVFASAGGFRSTAGDLLTYLVAQLHPEATGIASALQESHHLRADAATDRIALAWFYYPKDGTYWHDGATPGFSSAAFFNPQEDYAIAVLLNNNPSVTDPSESIAQHIRQRLLGRPAISLANVTVPANGGFLGLLRSFAAYWATMFGASAFIFGWILGLQGLAAQLPRRYFLQVSPILQSSVLCLLVCAYFLQPTLATPETLVSAQSNGLLSWSPSFWFLGFYQQWSGCPELEMLARRAWLALALALFVTGLAYALSYFRSLRKIVEEPDLLPGGHRTLWIPGFGASPQSAIVLFSIRTLLRSRPHRMIVAFYLGIAFAITILLVKSPSAHMGPSWQEVSAPLLASTVLLMGFAVVGTRVAFSLPVNLPANWIFRTVPLSSGLVCLAGYRRSLWILAVVPVWLASATLLMALWPWRMALDHLLLMGCFAAALVEVCLQGNPKIPFACAWLPGRSNFHITFVISALLLSQLAIRGAEWERVALIQNPALVYMVCVALGVIAIGGRLRMWLALRSESAAALEFEGVPPWRPVTLDLPRDGGISS